MIQLFIRKLPRVVFVFLLLFSVSTAVEAQMLSTTPEPIVELTDDYKLSLDTDYDVLTTYYVHVPDQAPNMPDQATAEAYMDQYERPYATITVVDLDNHRIMVSLEMNATTSDWTVDQWNQHLGTN